MIELNEKIKASIFFLSYFETLGYNNGQWEFNFGASKLDNRNSAAIIWLNIMHNFFALGGFSNINIKDWKSSDDTILAISTGIACLKGGKESDYINEFVSVLDDLKKDTRGSGFNTLNTLDFIKRANSVNKLQYKESMGGNGAAMRTSTIGLIYHKEKDLDKLIENSILSSRITHNYSIGYLGGLITALFTSYAIRNIPVWEWIDELFKLYESNRIDDYMKKTNVFEQYLKEKDSFFEKWYHYKEQRLNKFKYKPHQFIFFDERLQDIEYYNSLYITPKKDNYVFFGSSGLSATIVAYDSLLMSITSDKNLIDLNDTKISLDSLLFFSSLHFGDNDTTGAIAGAWFGALKGFQNFDQEKLNQLEFHKKLQTLSDSIIKKLS